MLDVLANLINESVYHAMAPVIMALLLGGICEKKRGFAGLAAVGIVLAIMVAAFRYYSESTGLLAAAPWRTGALSFIQNYLWYSYFAAIFVYVKLCFVCTWLTALFCFLTGYCTLQLFFGVIIFAGLRDHIVLPVTLLELVLAAGAVLAVVAVFRRRLSGRIILALQKRHMVSLLLLLAISFLFAEISLQVVLSVHWFIPLIPEGTQLPSEGLGYLDGAAASSVITNIIGCFVVLFALYHMLAYTETDLKEELFSTMYRQERAQYEQFKQNVDYINARYHDLKHILTLIQNDRGGAGRMLDDVTENVAFLQSEIDTGDETLDNILTDRYMRCVQKGIEFHLMTDGTTFEWIDTVDLYLIFCNMLDNAIEYLETVDQDRNISVGIKTVRQMIFIHQENELYESLRTGDGIPLSTKGAAHDHGFGIKSIIATVERYGGSVSVSTEGGRFSMDILLQKPRKTN